MPRREELTAPQPRASAALARALVRSEERLRAHGLTGGQAFDALVEALCARLGLEAAPGPEAIAAAADVPLSTGDDLLGLAYERFFPDLFKGRHGQYFTPRPLARLLIARLQISPGETVLDPACGSGGLLAEAARVGATVRGIERDPRLARLAAVGLRLAGADAWIQQADLFQAQPEPVDVVVANPPFSVQVTDPRILERYTLGRGQRMVVSDRLFVEALEGLVRPGGRAGIVLPWSVLINPSYGDVRARLEAAWERLAVCQLPEGVFRPFGGAAGRACLLWLQRRGAETGASSGASPASAGEPPTVPRWAAVSDPGYDVRLQRFKATDGAQIEALIRGEGWGSLPGDRWVPAPEPGEGLPVSELAVLRRERARPVGDCWVADLADADRGTGEVSPRRVPADEVPGRVTIVPGDVLVARMRPELGNVARAPGVSGPLVGSPEWLVLEARDHPGWLLHALRTEAWRARLPVTGGQTRPRTSASAVLGSRVPWPGPEVAARVDRLSASLHERRARLKEQLLALQDAVDAFARGALDEAALGEALDRLEGRDAAAGAGRGLG
ncbi:MAG TPA: hypothetical protein ENK18_27705 [Deltaproteobacteria bacterium]|nr:hypothetical protein [Deltaproteobacteria bacterium]